LIEVNAVNKFSKFCIRTGFALAISFILSTPFVSDACAAPLSVLLGKALKELAGEAADSISNYFGKSGRKGANEPAPSSTAGRNNDSGKDIKNNSTKAPLAHSQPIFTPSHNVQWSLNSFARPIYTKHRHRHSDECPSLKLQLSLPQQNIPIYLPKHLNIRTGPGTKYFKIGQTDEAGIYNSDLLQTEGCWILIGKRDEKNFLRAGWVSAKYLRFDFQDHFVMPRKIRSTILTKGEVKKEFSHTTYMIASTDSESVSQGSAVAISTAVLLTNCHVIQNNNRNIYILEKGKSYKAFLIKSKYHVDQCFIRSLELPLSHVNGIKYFKEIKVSEPSFAIGAPRSRNRTVTEGVVTGKDIIYTGKIIQTSSYIDHGSSGGGLFDQSGNLMGITTGKYRDELYAISASEFWK
jgi:S1-C subfamily serine protease